MEQILQPKSSEPLRLALLGSSRAGKSTFIQNVMNHKFVETYYPTKKSSPVLLDWQVSNEKAKLILNEYTGLKEFFPVLEDSRLVIPPSVIKGLSKEMIRTTNGSSSRSSSRSRHSSSKQARKIHKNSIYETILSDDSAVSPNDTSNFEITPILLELIDTPHFNPARIVPFLEASLDINLSPDILHNLANEPRRDHSANPLIVASGANDMNGKVDGYFFVYSCLPSLNPPEYSEDTSSPSQDTQSPLQLLRDMKTILEEAWLEYTMYKRGWEIGGEGDVFSFIYSIKSLWKKNSATQHLKDVPNKDEVMPPIMIVCTHCNSELRSPNLILEGRQLAKEWNCGFMEMDNLNVEEADILTSVLIREIVERNFNLTQS